MALFARSHGTNTVSLMHALFGCFFVMLALAVSPTAPALASSQVQRSSSCPNAPHEWFDAFKYSIAWMSKPMDYNEDCSDDDPAAWIDRLTEQLSSAGVPTNLSPGSIQALKNEAITQQDLLKCQSCTLSSAARTQHIGNLTKIFAALD